MISIRWRRTTNYLIWWSDSPNAGEGSVSIRPLAARMEPIPSIDVRQDSMASEQKLLFEAAIANSPPYPAERFAGPGIVICAGGARLFTCVLLSSVMPQFLFNSASDG